MIRKPLELFHAVLRGRDGNRGTAMVEFAFVAPILITLFLGGFQLMDATSTWRKVTTTTRAIADLTSQYKTLTDAEIDTVLAASQQIMAPFPVNKGRYRVSMINVSAAGVATVGWSRSLNGTPLVANAPYALPAGLSRPNLNIVVADVAYDYVPPAVGNYVGPIALKDHLYMMPRGSANITRTVN